MAEKSKKPKKPRKLTGVMGELENISPVGFAGQEYRGSREAGAGRGASLRSSVARYKQTAEAMQTLRTGKKGGAGEFFRSAGFENLGVLAGALFDRGATKEEIKEARKTLGLQQQEEKKETKSTSSQDNKKINYVVKISQDVSKKIQNIQTTLARIDKNIAYITERVSPKIIDAKQQGRKGKEGVQVVQYDPLAPAGEQFRQIGASGKVSTLKPGKEFMKSATMKAALMGGSMMTPAATGKVSRFTDPTEKSFTEEFTKTDPIDILRKDMNNNFEKVFKILEEQKKTLEENSSPISSLTSMLPNLGTLAKVGPRALTGLMRFVGPAGAAAMAGYVGYKVGEWLNDKFKLSDKLGEFMKRFESGPSEDQYKKAAEEGKFPGQDKRLADIGFAQNSDGKGGRTYTDLKTGKVYKFDELSKQQQNAIVDTRQPPAAPTGKDLTTPTGAPAIEQPSYAAAPSPVPGSAASSSSGISPDIKPVPQKKISNSEGKRAVIMALDKRGVSDPMARAAIMAQIAHESGGFTKLSENLNYSSGRLKQVFSYYRANPAEAQADSGNQVAIGSKAYGNRLGNGPPQTGDGYEYRGRGFIQLTGKSNYNRFGVNNPDDLLNPSKAAENAVDYMLGYKGNWNDIKSVTRYVNGDKMLGLNERAGYFTSFVNDPEITGMGVVGASQPTPESSVAAMAAASPAPSATPAVGAEQTLAASGMVGSSPGSATIPAPTATASSGGLGDQSITKDQTNTLLDIAAQNRAKNQGISVEQAKAELAVAPQATVQPVQTVSGQGMDTGSKILDFSKNALSTVATIAPMVMGMKGQGTANKVQQGLDILSVLGEAATRSSESAFSRALAKDFSHPTAFTTIGTI